MTISFAEKIRCFKVLVQFQKLVENLFNSKITYFQSDGGKEYDKGLFVDHLLAHGNCFRKSAPILNNKVVWLNVNIVILLKWLVVCLLTLVYLMPIGMMLF